jgi:metallophosphoesterase (TIGR00282 family)
VNILYIGDIMAGPGVRVVEQLLPGLRREFDVDVVVAQAENVSNGRGLTRADFEKLQTIGIDFCTGGNWTMHQREIYPLLDDPAQPITRPANYPLNTPGQGWKYLQTPQGKVMVISLLGSIVGKDASKPVDNPLKVIDAILTANKGTQRAATVVNFHGDYSSEKVIIGYYLDGRVSMVIGDHWHVPTADAMILPDGTAHISDVGMCGALHASLGITFDSVIPRWRDGRVTKNQLAEGGPLQFNAVLVDVDTQTGLAKHIEQIQRVI